MSGRLKPLPDVSAEDAAFIDTMIIEKYMPYQNIPDAPGKTVEEIKALGRRLFPFCPFGFQLAMCIYDWTTASFSRMVFLKIFQYTGIAQNPFPIDQTSIAQEIWESNWGSYTPQNADFMNSFMMKPASTLQSVVDQLQKIASKLHAFSDVQNRLLSAAMQALPRTSIFSKSQPFSGQMDIYQLGLDHFGIEFLECPANTGPVGQQLTYAFASAMADYVSKGKTITTKMVWSFTDSIQDAMHYSNGILLVANPPGDSFVWETAAYITPLSDDPEKTEYTFMPGIKFDVQSVDQVVVEGKSVVVITLQPKANQEQQIHHGIKELLPSPVMGDEAARLVEGFRNYPSHSNIKLGHKTGGRRCACVDLSQK